MTTLHDYFAEAAMPEKDIPAWFSTIAMRDPEGEPLRPRWHQIEGLNLIFKFTRSALFDEQGTGKTLPAQAALAWHGAVGNKPVVLMPPILLEQFRDAFFWTFQGIEAHLDMAIYHGTKQQRNKMLLEWHNGKVPIILTTPTLFMKEFAGFMALDCCVLVCDECKYWANPETKVFQAIKTFLGREGEKVLTGMNGTPAKNNLADLFGYCSLLTPGVYPSKQNFYGRHVIEKDTTVRFRKNGQLVERTIRTIDSFKDIDILRQNVMLHARRVEKKDVLELPDKQVIEFPIPLSAAHKKAYEHFVAARFMEFSDGTAISGEQTATMRQICMQSVINTELLHVDEPSAVFEAIDELLEHIDLTKTKFLIGAYYNRSIEMLAKHLEKYNPAVIYGPGSSNNQRNIDKLKSDDTCRGGIVNYQSGGVGLNLQKVTHYLISAEPTTVPGDFDQWCDRAHRSGQKNKVTIYVIRPKGTIWGKAIDSMLKKKSWNQSVINSDDLRKELLGEA